MHLGLEVSEDQIIPLDQDQAASRLAQALEDAPLANASLQLMLDHFFEDLDKDDPLYQTIANFFLIVNSRKETKMPI